jgi:hypothetical protein
MRFWGRVGQLGWGAEELLKGSSIHRVGDVS